VALLHEGGVLALDDPAALRAGLSGDVIELTADGTDRAAEMLGRLAGVLDVQTFGERLHVRLEEGAPLGEADRLGAALAQGGVAVTSVRRIPASLEDVFIARLAEGAKGNV
jgi:ABC-2 type transport system ATP-binding protein